MANAPAADGHLKKVLVVDDEREIVEILSRYLTDDGFLVVAAHDGSEAVRKAETEGPDLILLDIKLPTMQGLDAFKEIRARSDVPIIFLTSRSDEVDKIVGLELGADDYITKPFSPREVVARVKTVLRRAHADASAHGEDGASPSTIAIGELEIDALEHEVRLRGKPVPLTPTEFHILEVLASNVGRTFTRTQLLDLVRGDDLEIFDRTLDRHIANLRHKIEDDPGKPRFIKTVFGVGYKMSRP